MLTDAKCHFNYVLLPCFMCETTTPVKLIILIINENNVCEFPFAKRNKQSDVFRYILKLVHCKTTRNSMNVQRLQAIAIAVFGFFK